MKLYNSVGPNPQIVRMFLAEKGVSADLHEIDLRAGDNRRGDYVEKINVAGQMPALELDDGTVICEVTAICEYLEELHPEPVLIGATPEQRAETRMWTRRVDLGIVEPLLGGFRSVEGRRMFEPRMLLVRAEAGDDLKAMARDKLLWLDKQMSGRTFICGDRFSLADILLYCVLAMGQMVGQPIPDEAPWVKAWFERVKARPSATA